MNLIPRDFFLDDVFNEFLTSKDTDRFKCDLYEKDNKYYIEMDAPGFNKQDLSIEFDKGYLIVKVSKKDEKKDDNKNYIRRERVYQEFQRSFYVGDINSQKVVASFSNGTLVVEVPKEEKNETKKIISIE